MKMKKMLAILAALSVLGTTGLTVGAEDVTTTEPATETVATTEPTEETTETEITLAETTVAEEETTEETEIVDTKIYATKEYTMGAHTVKVVLYSDGTLDDSENPVECMDVYVDGNITNLSGMIVNTAMNGDGSNTIREDPDSFFTVDGVNTVTVTPYFVFGSPVTYTFNEATGTFVLFGEASPTTTTTTTTTDSTTTTTTTVDPAETEEALRKIFEEYVAKKQAADESGETGGITSFYYDAAAKKAYGVYGVNGSMHSDILCIITKDGVVEQSNVKYGEDAHRFKEAVCFTNNGSTFVAAIVDLYSNGGTLYALNIYNVSGNEPLRTNLYKIYVGNVISPYGYPITDPNSSIALDDYFTVKSDGVITVNGVDYTYDTASAQFVKVGSDSGKTDNGSASNAPASTATKNTSGTPKTGDTTTVPAVAVGLTLTAAGVVAFISKRKKK